jgi:hypothetical protein
VRIRILGGGWYGCHLALTLMDYHEVELHEMRGDIFQGASGANPARLHMGYHYPRSKVTREHSQRNLQIFKDVYRDFVGAVHVNIYGVAEENSLVDYGNYIKALEGEVPFLEIDPIEYGMYHCEGAILTPEYHIRVDAVRKAMKDWLGDIIKLNVTPESSKKSDFDVTIDCTFAALRNLSVDRYEACVTFVYKDKVERDTAWAVTIMDGPFPSFYPHFEENTVSLTSAKWTPLKKCKTYFAAQKFLNSVSADDLASVRKSLEADMQYHFEYFRDWFDYSHELLAVRAMPKSAADSRIVAISHNEKKNWITVRAGKIDAVFDAEDAVKEILSCW